MNKYRVFAIFDDSDVPFASIMTATDEMDLLTQLKQRGTIRLLKIELKQRGVVPHELTQGMSEA